LILLLLFTGDSVNDFLANSKYPNDSVYMNLAMEIVAFFGLPEKRAVQIIEKVKTSIQNWKVIANNYKISKSEQAIMAKAFYAG
jgi:hypothetical protein